MRVRFSGSLAGWLRDMRGTVPIEYGLIASFVSLALLILIYSFGDSLELLYDNFVAGLLEYIASAV